MLEIKELLIFLSLIYHVQGEYYISGSTVPQYLSHKFYNVAEKIFPSDIRITVSLTRFTGTLLYSIDRNMNQLILSLDNSIDPMMKIEFNGQEIDYSLSEQCNCKRCQYEIFDLRIQIIDKSMILQCDGRKPKYEIFNRNYSIINNEYPIPYTRNALYLSESNEGQIWLANHQHYGNLTPSSAQPSGCLFGFFYKQQLIIFQTVFGIIYDKCLKVCALNICNGGDCYETYKHPPICDCTMTFLNGRYCNDTIKPIKDKLKDRDFQFDILKLSWKSTFNDILELQNKNYRITMKAIGSNLYFEYLFQEGNTIKIIQETLSNSYESNKESILVVRFNNKSINLKYNLNDSWQHASINNTEDLRSQRFNRQNIKARGSIIELLSKTFAWNSQWIEVLQYNQTTQIKTIDISNLTDPGDKINHEKDPKMTIIISVIVGVFVVAIVILLVYVIKLRKKQVKGRHELKVDIDNPPLNTEVVQERTESIESTVVANEILGKSKDTKNNCLRSQSSVEESLLMEEISDSRIEAPVEEMSNGGPVTDSKGL